MIDEKTDHCCHWPRARQRRALYRGSDRTRKLGVKLYDKVSIEKEITSGGYSEELVSEMDEKPVNFFASRRIGRFSNSLEVNVAEKTFAMLRSKAAEGESFVVIGRCGEQVLENNPNCISIFICGDPQFKLNRVMNKLWPECGAGH